MYIGFNCSYCGIHQAKFADNLYTNPGPRPSEVGIMSIDYGYLKVGRVSLTIDTVIHDFVITPSLEFSLFFKAIMKKSLPTNLFKLEIENGSIYEELIMVSNTNIDKVTFASSEQVRESTNSDPFFQWTKNRYVGVDFSFKYDAFTSQGGAPSLSTVCY
jgi:hypothetical protein